MALPVPHYTTLDAVYDDGEWARPTPRALQSHCRTALLHRAHTRPGSHLLLLPFPQRGRRLPASRA